MQGWKFRVEATEPPASIPTSLDVMFTTVRGCPEGFEGPLHSLMGLGNSTRLLILACEPALVPRH